MSAKFVSGLGDEGSDLNRQIGCMTGILQIFDRQHLISGRRTTVHNQKRISSGNACSEPSGCSPRVVLDKNRSSSENQRFSMESSRNSFSSSSCSSSFSSLECNRSTHQEHCISEPAIVRETSLKDLPKLQVCRDDEANPVMASPGSATGSAKAFRQSTNIRDVVKDSIYREKQGLSIRTGPTENSKQKHQIRLKDSPRPQPIPKLVDGSYADSMNKKTTMPGGLGDPLNISSNIKERTRFLSELKELPRPSSLVTRDYSFLSRTRDTPRFSYDARDVPRISMDSRENNTPRQKERPRLSLDSRESSMQNSNFGSKAISILKELGMGNSKQRELPTIASINQDPIEEKSTPSVVAKLMGLEAMPGRTSFENSNSCEDDSSILEGQIKGGVSSNSSKAAEEGKREIKISVITQKIVPHSKIPIETAPWVQPAKGRGSPKRTPEYRETRAKQQHESVYSEIQRKLKDLEFQPHNKDLRALKQILDAIHTKGLLEIKKVKDGHSSELSSNMILESDAKCNSDMHPVPSFNSKSWDSPIVIMKPAKSINGVVRHSIIDAFESPVGIPKVRTSGAVDSQCIAVSTPPESVRTPKNFPMEKSSDRVNGENALQKARLRNSKLMSKNQKLSSEGGGGSTKSSNPSSPRMQPKKLAMEKKGCSSSTSCSNKSQKPFRQAGESISPRSKSKPKKLNDNNHEERSVLSRGNEFLQSSKNSTCLAPHLDNDLACSYYSSELNQMFFQEGQSGPRLVNYAASSKKKEQSVRESCASEGSATTSEQPSPVSVLDPLLYKGELSGSPAKAPFKEITVEPRRNLLDSHSAREIDRKKLRNIDNLVRKLELLSSTDGQDSQASHIALLCETKNPNHGYVSEILLASGLLLLDNFGASSHSFPPKQIHQCGSPISPDLFMVLEQKRLSSLQNAPTADLGRSRRRLVFDVVNEILVQILDLDGAGQQPASRVPVGKLSKRVPSGQFLLKKLCNEVDLLDSKGPQSRNSEDDDGDGLKMILSQEFSRQAGGWTDMGREVSGLVLDIERLIFKDMIDEVVKGEAVMVKVNPMHSRRRQLFP